MNRKAEPAQQPKGRQRDRHDRVAEVRPAVPRYRVVAEKLTAAITSGQVPVGATLPTEHELCKAHGISRFTAREALRVLSEAGLVSRKPRTGSVVISSSRRQPYVQTLESIDDLLQYSADTEMTMLELGTVSPRLVAQVNIGTETRLDPSTTDDRPWSFGLGLRTRRDGGPAVCITRVYLNPMFRGILRRLDRHSGAIYKVIETEYGVQVARIEQRLTACQLPREDADRLNVRARTPGLRLLRQYFDAENRLLELSDSIHPADRFGYAMTIRREPG